MPSKSKSQQRFFGMVDAYKKGEMKNASSKIKKAAKGMSMDDVKDFAETKHKGLPEKVEEQTIIRLTESDLHRIVKESINRVLSEATISIGQNLIDKIKMLVRAAGGNVNVFYDDDIEELQIYDGGFDGEGESHGVVSLNNEGAEMDNGDFYPYEDLSQDDLKMLIEYLEWYVG